MDIRLLLSIGDAAEILSITPRKLRQLIRDGRVPAVNIGDGEMGLSPERLREWLANLHEEVPPNA
jgi:excisionase family DNA binding protein